MGKPDYIGGKVYWSAVTRKDGKHLRATIRYKETSEDGTVSMKRKTKMFTIAETENLCPVNERNGANGKKGEPNEKLQNDRRGNAANDWKRQLIEEHDESVRKERERIEQEREEAVRKREEVERKERERIAREREEAEKAKSKRTMCELVSNYINRRAMISENPNLSSKDTGANAERIITRSTVRDYRHTLNFLQANFPDTDVTELKPIDIINWEESQLMQGHSLSRVRKAHVLCKQVLDDAVIRGYIAHSCMASLKAPTLGKRENNALSRADAQRLTLLLSGADRPSAAIVGAMLALHCGLRGGEVCGLQWGSVDFETRHLTVKRSVGIGDGGKFLKEPKSESGNRTIWMDDYAVDVLRKCRAQTLALRDNITKGFDDLFVVGDVDGSYLSPTTLSRQFTAVSKAFGLRGKTGEVPTLHKMRHTFTDALRGGKGNDKAIRDVMGHSAKGITDEYGTKDQELMDDAVKRAARWLAPEDGIKAKADIFSFGRTGTEG